MHRPGRAPRRQVPLWARALVVTGLVFAACSTTTSTPLPSSTPTSVPAAPATTESSSVELSSTTTAVPLTVPPSTGPSPVVAVVGATGAVAGSARPVVDVPLAAPTTTVAPSTTAAPVASIDDVLAASYGWAERSERVKLLQVVVGVAADGLYGSQTRAAHLAALQARGMSTDHVPAPPAAPVPTPSTSGELCTVESLVAFAHSVLDRHAIAVPRIEIDPAATRSIYYPGSRAIVYRMCIKPTSAAHELGHYVHHLAIGTFDAWIADAAEHFANGGWVQGTEFYPGLEHAAHCVGNVLWGYGTYTKCPNATMHALAAAIVARA